MEKNVNVNMSGWFLGLLAILFIGLKLTGYITWSWVWVLSPLWIPFAIVALVFIVIFIIGWFKKIKEIIKDENFY